MKSLGNYSISEARYEFKYNFKPNHFEWKKINAEEIQSTKI
jgi:hypothetical protein